MASTTYLAPGVYVEEVPSAQQPIAGVGTNTVAFLGIVPDVIYYPEPNPDYDPVLAQAALRLATLRAQLQGATEEDRTRIEREMATARQRMESDIARLTREIADLDEQIRQLPQEEPSDPDAESPDGGAGERRAALSAERAAKQDELTDLRQQRDASQAAPTAPAPPAPALDEAALLRASVLRPYILRKFDVEVDPYDTKLCTNFTEYTNRFGPFPADFPEPAPNTPEVQALVTSTHRALTHAVYGFFKNGGTRCFVARVKTNNAAEIDRALAAFESIDAVAIIAAPGLSTPSVWNQLVAHCDNNRDRFAVLDCQEVVGTDSELNLQLLSYDTAGNLLPQRSKNAAFYFPYIEVVDPAKQIQDQDPARRVPAKYWGRLFVPPSGHIAGIYARTDEERGVHKAPANSPILGALNVKYYISKQKQELLNPQGVNCIRNMNGNITVWGARTIGGDKNSEWKYINVRRFFLFLSESIDEGTQWVVFEPNDPALWGKIRRNVSAFLTNVWRAGALFGLTPEEAFYVKCDAETNPPEVRDLGMVVTEIGVAIVRPAEFVIFRVTQATGPRTV
jgi:Bacteriophage tail sheath protein